MDFSKDFKAGMQREERTVVSEKITADMLGSGLLPVYGTPALLALMEKAAANLAQEHLPEGWTSVGISVNIAHSSATPKGMEVRAVAEVLGAKGRKIFYKLTAWDEVGKIGGGTHERFIVPSADFLKKTEGKLAVGEL